jgi:hypothetical protein
MADAVPRVDIGVEHVKRGMPRSGADEREAEGAT